MRVSIILLLSACGRIGFDASGDSVVGECTAGSPSDGFDIATLPCATWGSVTTNGFDVTRSASALAITPTATAATGTDFGGCNASGYNLSNDLLLEITSVLDGPTSYTNMTFYFGGSGGTGAGIQVGQDRTIYAMNKLGQMGNRPYDPVAMRFWRLRVVGNSLAYQVSRDARSWTDLASSELFGDPTNGLLTFGGGRSASGVTGAATFAGLNICP